MNTVLEIHDVTIKKAFDGDAHSKGLLTKLAQGLLDSNLTGEAALLFKEVARSHRIAEFRASALVEELTKNREELQSEIGLLEFWIQSHPLGLTPIPAKVSAITKEAIWSSLIDRANDPVCDRALGILECELSKLGEVFFTPGGTIDRRASTLLEQYFGLTNIDEPELFSIQRVRIAMDLLAAATITLVRVLDPT